MNTPKPFFHRNTCKRHGCKEPLTTVNPWHLTPGKFQYCLGCREENAARNRRHQATWRQKARENKSLRLQPKLSILRRAGYADATVMVTLTTGSRSLGPKALMVRASESLCNESSLVDYTCVATRGKRGCAPCWSLHILFCGERDLLAASRLCSLWLERHPPTLKDKRAVLSDHSGVVVYFARNMMEPGAFRRNRAALLS